MNDCLPDASSNQAAFKSGGPSYFSLPPPLDLTSSRRQISVVDSNEDGSNSTSSSTAESLEDERKLDSYSSNCKFESTSDDERPTRSPVQNSEERWMDLKNEFHSTFARHNMPSPDPIFNSAHHSLSRLMNYVHNVSPMALLQQQYAFRQNLVPPHHLLPPPNPLLPTSILGTLAPTNQRFLSPPHLKTDQSKSETAERQLVSREMDRNEGLSKGQIKDEGYFERRRKNNEAAKRSRDLRRMKEEEMAKRAKLLENENSILRAENNALKYEVTRLHTLLSRTFNNPER